MRRVILDLSAAALACFAPAAVAQVISTPPQAVFIQALPGTCADVAVSGGGVGVIASDGSRVQSASVAGSAPRVVTGAPYSATGRSETVQTLADGNRIVRSNTIRYFRDARGRTRTEYNLSALGPIALPPSSSLVVIDDPAASKRVVLHPDQKLVTEMPLTVCGQPDVEAGAVPFTAGVPVPAPGAGDVMIAAESPQTATSSLPERAIRGLRAVGKRTELSIPAGELGNEMPITVRSETWYSPELQIVLSASHRDPLFGDTTYQLVDIVRKEPDAKLFAIPRDYAVRPLPDGTEFDVAIPVPSMQPRSGPVVERRPWRAN